MITRSNVSLRLRKRIFAFSLIVLPLTSAGAGMTVYIDNLSNVAQEPIFASGTVVALDENITVQFTAPIHNTQQYEKTITTYPKTNLVFSWKDDNKTLLITPRTVWRPETRYSIAFPHNTQKAESQQSTLFSFETIAYPTVISTNIPESGERYLNEGDDILITFDHDITGFDVHAVARPTLKTQQIYNAQNKTLRVHIEERAKNADGFHTLTVFAKHKKQPNAQFYPIYSLTFNTLLPQPESWPQPYDERLHLAQISTAPQITSGKYIDVNLKAQITTLFEDGKFVRNFMNSTGAKDTPTPTGVFQIYNKDPYALSNMFQVYMPYWMAFTPDGLYGFHGLVVWPEGHEEMPSGGRESEKNIGSAVSPGCVRHDAEMSRFIYDWADIGTKVVIY